MLLGMLFKHLEELISIAIFKIRKLLTFINL